ncbi:conserved hypothetical protein [Culex quinquefasciatus]|uniref:RRM domain-containing protein n=1 Tax=Culex quinquefasciatus TaxID=7176 RepID=B0WTX6_CULQU|nr:conserved hypothetical protein [Culex quinquefasciatus]|eukprot:XP_001856212.1 conserved hypothetical protein [Culex quinquefasciatus]
MPIALWEAVVLAEEAHPVEDLDVGACRELLSGAQGKLSSASTDVERAEAELPLKWPRLSSRLSNKVRAKHQAAGESVSSTHYAAARMKMSKLSNQTNSQDPQAVNSRVFVGNLNTFQCSKTDVERMFQRYGRLAVQVSGAASVKLCN